MARGDRSPDQQTITISLSRSLVRRIDALAQKDNRSRSNWIVTELMRRVEELTPPKNIHTLSPESLVAEQPQPPPRQRRDSKA
jgi:metal-responsive CopG/Arc/MetJ family transcriptional regulator